MYQELPVHASTNRMLQANSENRPLSMIFDQLKLLRYKKSNENMIYDKTNRDDDYRFIFVFNTHSPQVFADWCASHEYFQCQGNGILYFHKMLRFHSLCQLPDLPLH